MAAIKAIRSEAALRRIDALMDAAPGTPEGEDLDVLTDSFEHYEEALVPMSPPAMRGRRR